jgi:hypothetical protein
LKEELVNLKLSTKIFMSKNSKNTGLSYGVKIFRERENEVEGGEVSGGPAGPHHATARGHATMWCGGMVVPPEVSQVPLCPIFDIKI